MLQQSFNYFKENLPERPLDSSVEEAPGQTFVNKLRVTDYWFTICKEFDKKGKLSSLSVFTSFIKDIWEGGYVPMCCVI